MLNTIRKGEWLEIIIQEKWDGKTVEDIFRQEWEAPKKLTHIFRMDKKVRMDGQAVNWTVPLTAGKRLEIHLFEEEEFTIPPHYQEINILYEDDHVLVLNKPPFINTHPNDNEHDIHTLLNAVAFYMQAKGEIRNTRQVHRLDRDTTGAILFAKHALAGAILDRMLEKREIKRTYLAVVHGLLRQKKGTIKEPIGRDRHHPTRRRVSVSGQTAVTHYEVVKEDKTNKLTYVKCWLETGRTHQIRVHFSHIGHPLAGDLLYGGKPIADRQALHAAKLEFLHPFSEEEIICYAAFIDDPSFFVGIDVYTL
ncbi:RluA family pseudouridine synthase [Bacillus sp. BRMEA1]|uniref:RluA family pseudouridine synthase n=1 Tax=Neobacillus endophyticus TaxID=2738405 RepID=UPI00156717B8|nr:RluA family pseudouridine synthase [Neobacillus endophyticus]NRD78263.1 RluA family pseudouridine synthase [Neobacillus endophyticus]